MTIEHLPGTNLNPLAILGRALENKPTKVIVISCDENNIWRVAWSAMQVQELVYGTVAAKVTVDRVVSSNIDT